MVDVGISTKMPTRSKVKEGLRKEERCLEEPSEGCYEEPSGRREK